MNIKGSNHLTLSDRIKIQEGLSLKDTLKNIALQVFKDERTISKEIKKHRIFKDNNRSMYYRDKDHIKECKRLERFPFVCNGCGNKKGCMFRHYADYDALKAHEEYRTTLSESRNGLDISLEDKIRLDAALKEGTQKGQSIYHIVSSSKDINYSLRSVYRLVDRRQTIIQNIDLIRKVKLKPRKHYAYDQTKDKAKIREGRNYEDFIRFITVNGYPPVTEIDTVEGSKKEGGKCLLTIHINAAHFTLGFLLESKSFMEVNRVFIYLQDLLGKEMYSKIFQVILTDRGGEFIDPLAIEYDHKSGEKLTDVFFCNSYASYQKGSIEEDHTLIRRIIPKGTGMNDLDQKKIDTMMSHIASYRRKSIESTPYQIFLIMYGKDILDKLKIREIIPDQVTLKPSILK